MTLTESRNQGTRRSDRNQNFYRRSPEDESFDSELPAEARVELEEAHRPPKPRSAERIVGTPVAQDTQPQPGVYLRPPAYRPLIAEPAPPAKHSYGTAAIWILVILLFLWVVSRNNGPSVRAPESRPVPTPSGPRPVEVRRALPVVDVRRALPAVPRALPVTSAASTESNWQSIRMPDGTVLPVSYQGDLFSSAALPGQGKFVGEEWSTGTTSWVWMVPAGAAFPSWVDP